MGRGKLVGCLALALAGCGGGGGPSGPSVTPTVAPQGGSSVRLELFYDENANGQRDASELTRVPDVTVTLGGRQGKSDVGTGQVVVQNVPDGSQSVQIQGSTLPPFFQPGAPVEVQVPQAAGSTALVPLTLPLGRDSQPNVYMAFGDSITRGDGASSPGTAWPARAQARLGPHFAQAQVVARGADATNTYEALERFNRNIEGVAPAYVLVLYGTNDWNDPRCQVVAGCFTIDNLRTVVRRIQSFGALPVLGTIPPVNPAVNADRNLWVSAIDDAIKQMAAQEGAAVADVYATMQRRSSNLASLFADGVHPNDAGHDAIAEAFFEAVAHGQAAR